MKTELKQPLPDATKEFLSDMVLTAAIDYSFTDHSEGIIIDFQYLCTRLDNDTMVILTDKIKDLVMDALEELEYEED